MRGRIFWEGILAIILCQANMKTPKRGSVKIRVARTVASLCVQLSSGDKKSSTLTTCTTGPYILNLLPGLLAKAMISIVEPSSAMLLIKKDVEAPNFGRMYVLSLFVIGVPVEAIAPLCREILLGGRRTPKPYNTKTLDPKP